jgi:hypothetical protein
MSVTQEQLDSMNGDQKTLLPAGFQRPGRWSSSLSAPFPADNQRP